MYKIIYILLFCVVALLAKTNANKEEINSVAKSPLTTQDSVNEPTHNLVESSAIEAHSHTQTTANKREDKEVYVDEGVVFVLQKDDAMFKMYGDSYAHVPLSKKLKVFLAQQHSSLDARTLRSAKSTTQIYNQGKEILFYYSSIKGSNLYSEIAPVSFKLTLEEYNDESKNPHEIIDIYRIHNFDEAILEAIPHSLCHIVQTRHFIRDRTRSEILINLNNAINPRLLTQGKIELFLKCYLENLNLK